MFPGTQENNMRTFLSVSFISHGMSSINEGSKLPASFQDLDIGAYSVSMTGAEGTGLGKWWTHSGDRSLTVGPKKYI